MKKFLVFLSLPLLFAAATPSWAGCGAFGTVTYVWSGSSATNSAVMAIIDGTACVVSGNRNGVAAAAAILAQAKAGAAAGVKGFLLGDRETGDIEAGIQ